MHACDREILRLDLEQITRSRNIYNASTQFYNSFKASDPERQLIQKAK